MNIQQQIENTEKAIQYYTEMVEKYPENESMRSAKEEQEEKWKKIHAFENLKIKPSDKKPEHNQEVLIKNSDRREPVKSINTIQYELSGQRLVDTFKEMEEEIFKLKKENEKLKTKPIDTGIWTSGPSYQDESVTNEIHTLKQRIIQLECYDLEIEKEKNKKLRKQIKKLKEKLKIFKPK